MSKFNKFLLVNVLLNYKQKMKKLFAFSILIIAFASSALAQPTTGATTSASATAVILTPISISNGADMDFGSVAVNATTDGTVVLTAAAATTRSVSGGVTAVGGTPSSAAFTVTGVADQTYSITLPTDGTTVLTGPGPDMGVDFVCNLGTSGLLTGGTETFYVGATLSVAGGQTAGSYSGTFEVSVDYE